MNRGPSCDRPVLVVGASGAVGGYLERHLSSRGPVVGTRLHDGSAADRFTILDATAPVEVRRAFDSIRPSAVVIAAALADVDRCEWDTERSFAVNARLPALVAAECARRETPVVHFSTDYVFDGAAGPYGEPDPTGPINTYGRHKLAGEHAVLGWARRGARAAVVRTCVVYGGARPGAPEALAAALRAGQTVRLSAVHRNSPVHAADLARAVDAILGLGAGGLFHVGGPETISRLAFGRAVARALGLAQELVQPPAEADPQELREPQRAPRPRACGLRNERAADELGHQPRLVAEGLAELFAA